MKGRVWWGLCEGEGVVGPRVRGRVWWGLCEGEGVVGPRVRGRVWVLVNILCTCRSLL